jgi:heat-inducible transcriptional repressor
MDARHRDVLIAVIREYIDSAEPVGSRALAKRHMPTLSPATIRNAMADLEEMGYLSQPHASAGRVPTDNAYRFYVDSFPPASPTPVTKAEPPAREPHDGIERLMEQTTARLSATTHFTGLLLAPPLKHAALARVDLIPLENDRVLAVVVTDTGWVTARALTLPGTVDRDGLRDIAREITRRVRGRSVREVLEDWAAPADPLDPLRTRIGNLFEQILGVLRDCTLYVSGATNMLDHPEFLDIGNVRQMLRTFEEKERLVELLSGLSQWGGGVRVVIGEENPVEELQECTLITSTYAFRGQVLGILGIVGPRRMPYPQVISIVDDVAHEVSERLSRERRDLYLPS